MRTYGAASTSLAANIEALDQSVFDAKNVTDDFVREKVAVEIADDLMHFDNDSALGPIREFIGSTRGSIIAHWRVQYLRTPSTP